MFEHFVDLLQPPEAAAAGRADQVERFLISQIKQGRRSTKRQLEDADLSMSRRDLRAAVTALEVAGRIVPAELPPEHRQGSRTHYLCPIDYCAEIADPPGAVPAEALP